MKKCRSMCEKDMMQKKKSDDDYYFGQVALIKKIDEFFEKLKKDLENLQKKLDDLPQKIADAVEETKGEQSKRGRKRKHK